jgi:hypothetical protein
MTVRTVSPIWLAALLAAPCFSQPPQAPDLDAQRAAMKKLDFLVGKWSGEARMRQGPGEPLELVQTESAEYRLDGLILLVEGIGKKKSDGTTVLRALATLSYDDGKGVYRMRAYDDGRYMETEMKLGESGKELTWGLESGQMRSRHVLKLNEHKEWTETGEVTIGTQPPVRFWELTVRKQK